MVKKRIKYSLVIRKYRKSVTFHTQLARLQTVDMYALTMGAPCELCTSHAFSILIENPEPPAGSADALNGHIARYITHTHVSFAQRGQTSDLLKA